MLHFISGGEIIFVFFIILMIFGADKIPEIARGMGKELDRSVMQLKKLNQR